MCVVTKSPATYMLTSMAENAERVTLVNAHGEPQETIPRTEAKQRRAELLAAGKYMPVVAAVVFDRLGSILVHRRGTGGHTADVRSGVLDLVYGGLPVGMDPEQAVRKETREETGVHVDGAFRLISEGLNVNQFYRYFYVGTTMITDDQLRLVTLETPEETTWVGFMTLKALREAQQSGMEEFAGSFFGDIEAAQRFLADNQ